MIKKIKIILSLLILALLILTIWLPLNSSICIVFGSALMLFIPGYILTFIFFPNHIISSSIIKKAGIKLEYSLNWIERIVFGILLSISVTILALTAIRRFMSLTPLINILTIISVNITCIIVALLVLKIRKRTQNKLTTTL